MCTEAQGSEAHGGRSERAVRKGRRPLRRRKTFGGAIRLDSIVKRAGRLSHTRRLASDLLPAIRAALADRRFISSTVRLDEARRTSPDLPGKPTPTENHEENS